MRDLFIFDMDFNLIGEISEYVELRIERNYSAVSQMTLRVPATEQNIELLRRNRIITTQTQPQRGFLIQYFNYNDAESEMIEVFAYSLNFFLSWRVIPNQQFYTGNIEDVIKGFVNINFINPLNPNRVFPNLRLLPNGNIPITLESSKIGGTVLEHCWAIANDNEISFDIEMNHADRVFEFRIWRGVDRSVNQDVNSRVMFSEQFDNILNQNYISSLTDYKTTAVVVGEEFYDEGLLTIVCNDELKGFERRETFIGSSLTSDFTDDEGYRNLLSEEDYREVLRQEGLETLKTLEEIETFVANVDVYNQFIFGQDYDLGDIVSIKNEKLGRVLNPRIIKVTLTINSTGTNLEISFGTNIPSLLETIKRKVK